VTATNKKYYSYIWINSKEKKAFAFRGIKNKNGYIELNDYLNKFNSIYTKKAFSKAN